MNPLFILELLTLLAAMAEDASHSDDIRPQIRALLPLFPGRSRASTLDEAITHDVLPNVPPGRIAAFVSDNLIDLAIALGVKPAPGSSKYHERGTLSRMDDGPHPLPRGVKGSLVAYQPWVAREILRRVADAPYVVTLASLRASSGDVYAHAFPDEKAPPGHIESLVSDLWQNLRFIAWHFDETGEDPRFVDYPTARAQTFTWLRFAPGVEAGDVVPETGHVVQTLPDGSFVTELRMTELGVAKGITRSLGVDIVPILHEWFSRIGPPQYLALRDATGRPRVLARISSFFGNPTARLVPATPAPALLPDVRTMLAHAGVRWLPGEIRPDDDEDSGTPFGAEAH